jgi:hypothetical protein
MIFFFFFFCYSLGLGWWAIDTMCLHVLCLSLKGPPFPFLVNINWISTLSSLSHSAQLFLCVSDTISWICRTASLSKTCPSYTSYDFLSSYPAEKNFIKVSVLLLFFSFFLSCDNFSFCKKP